MAKRTKAQPPQPVPAHATARKFDGGAIKIEVVLQPQDAAKLTDQLVNALIRNNREGPE